MADDTNARELLVDQRIPYKPVGNLGSGASGHTILCRRMPNNDAGPAFVAVKCNKKMNRLLELNFTLREAKMLKACNHPTIVKLLDVFQSHSGRLHIVMEYVEFCANSILDNFPHGFPATQLKLTAWQLCLALRHLHDLQILHRDIKPSNVLLGSDGSTKLCDFGLARFLHSPECGMGDDLDRRLTSYVVTRWYRPPEILLGLEYGPPADVFSLGCTIAELATGRAPFPGSSTIDQLHRLIQCLGPLPQHMAAAVQRRRVLRTAISVAAVRGRGLSDQLLRLGAREPEPQLQELLESCLALDPTKRLTPHELLQLPYFKEVPVLVAGTPLEGLYLMERRKKAAAAAVGTTASAASQVRGHSTQMTAGNTLQGAMPPQPPHVDKGSNVPNQEAGATASGAAIQVATVGPQDLVTVDMVAGSTWALSQAAPSPNALAHSGRALSVAGTTMREGKPPADATATRRPFLAPTKSVPEPSMRGAAVDTRPSISTCSGCTAASAAATAVVDGPALPVPQAVTASPCEELPVVVAARTTLADTQRREALLTAAVDDKVPGLPRAAHQKDGCSPAVCLAAPGAAASSEAGQPAGAHVSSPRSSSRGDRVAACKGRHQALGQAVAPVRLLTLQEASTPMCKWQGEASASEGYSRIMQGTLAASRSCLEGRCASEKDTQTDTTEGRCVSGTSAAEEDWRLTIAATGSSGGLGIIGILSGLPGPNVKVSVMTVHRFSAQVAQNEASARKIAVEECGKNDQSEVPATRACGCFPWPARPWRKAASPLPGA